MTLAVAKDHLVVSIVGFVFGGSWIPVLENIKPDFWRLSFWSAVGLIFGFTIFSNLALLIGGWLGSRFYFVWQFAKFGAVGSMNAALDLGLLNLLSFIFKVYSGWPIIIFNVIALSIALTNSYLLNKFWSFKSEGPIRAGEFSAFVTVSLFTLAINTSLVYILTTMVGAPESVSPPFWENIAKLIGVPLTLIINFSGYKFLVFKK